MRSGRILQQTPHFRLLSDAQLKELHFAGLEILRRTGVDVLEDEARQLLADAGAAVDGVRVRIPPHLADWAIEVAPSRVALCDSRQGNPRMFLEGTRSYYGTGSDTIATIDLESGERRPPVKSDVANVAKLCDALPYIHFVMSMGIAQDVPSEITDLHHFQAMVRNTEKPLVVTAWNLDNLKDIVHMAEAVAGGEENLLQAPFMIVYTEPVSPLTLTVEPTQKILYSASKGIPVICGTGKVGGATSPVTVAGAVAQGIAEALSGVVVAQLKREGAPVIFGGERLHMDMSTTISSYAAPEFILSVAVNAEVAAYYDLPSWSYAGCSDAKLFDQQAAAEGTLMTVFSALSGGNLNHDVGYLEAGLTSSLESIVAFNEIIGMVERLMQGVTISDEMLALKIVHDVGPGGEFLTTNHTFKHFRDDWQADLFDRQHYESWKESGRKSLGQRANERVKQVLAENQVEQLPDDVEAELAQIIERAERERVTSR